MNQSTYFDNIEDYIICLKKMNFNYGFNSDTQITKSHLHKIDNVIITYSENQPSTGFFYNDNQDYYNFRFILEGTETYNFDGKKIILNKEECFFSPPDSSIVYERNTYSRGINILIPIKNFLSFSQLTYIRKNRFDCKKGMGKIIFDFTCSLEKNLKELDEISKSLIVSNYLSMIIEWLQREKPEYSTCFLDILHIIDLNINNPEFYLNSLSQIIGKSERTIQSILKEHQLTFSSYLLDKRLLSTTHDLIFSSLNTTEIALKWGFYDSSHFSKCFKKKYNCTPRVFKENHIKNNKCEISCVLRNNNHSS